MTIRDRSLLTAVPAFISLVIALVIGTATAASADAARPVHQITAAGGSLNAAAASFDRQAAVDWAIANVSTPESFPDGDCGWFASQALWEGGLPTSDEWNGKSWDHTELASQSHYPGPTRAAVHANLLTIYLVDSGLATKTLISWPDNTAAGAQKGDLIAYDWDNGANGTIDHVAVVTSLNLDGYPSVSQHTPARDNRYWSWDTGNDDWIENAHTGKASDGSPIKPKAYLIHIVG